VTHFKKIIIKTFSYRWIYQHQLRTEAFHSYFRCRSC